MRCGMAYSPPRFQKQGSKNKACAKSLISEDDKKQSKDSAYRSTVSTHWGSMSICKIFTFEKFEYKPASVAAVFFFSFTQHV